MLQLTVRWQVTDGTELQEYNIPGLSQGVDTDNYSAEVLHNLIDSALTFSRQQLEKLLDAPVTLLEGKESESVLRTLLTRRTAEIKPLLGKVLSDQDLERESTESHQKQMDNLCDTLGITRISLNGTSVLEASAMINELQYVTKSMVKVGD